ncbi:putative baseplate assembly protein [Bradyrhizobium sp. 2S1]|uniref:putative baseplate assembly protein n=1 Tax=Bradyrhizobium sp. 2S1 TaxID=1404429 RepID=UPI001407F788|nr:putative baseplate assembly protein [Bradyrhizobium sp. 2S1]MCK7668310.1 putative baseplate assembly protein [Bradyrhizobium sp. 2S1]
MKPAGLDCGVANRRKKLFKNGELNGIDFLDVSEDQLSLCVHFFGEIPELFGKVPEDIALKHIRIEGGRRIRGIRAIHVSVDRAGEDEDACLHITLDKFGDFSTYRLCLIEVPPPADGKAADRHKYEPLSGLDPRYSCLDFTFKAGCPSEFDCRPVDECPPETLPAPEINYLAKDYASFRQLMFDRLALTMPEWRERHVPDIGITLVELLAYAGDHLSYYQDAVATEAHLDTARLRTSVRRHVRLVDYRMHEGVNARAWVTVETDADLLGKPADGFYFITGFPNVPASSGNVVRADDLAGIPQQRYEVFEPLTAHPGQTFDFRAAHSRIRFYTWGDTECCLPQGATRATLLDAKSRVLHLGCGDVLIFEEVIGPTTGNESDADKARRHAVRITRETPSVDRLYDINVVEIEWGAEDALPFPFCLSARLPAPDCSIKEDISVARGNVVLVDHGRLVGERETYGPVDKKATIGECSCEGSVIETTDVPHKFAAELHERSLTYSEPLAPHASAARSIEQDPRCAIPALALVDEKALEDDKGNAVWRPQYDLLASAGGDRHFVVEIDDARKAKLRFGDGELGHMPAVGTVFRPIPRPEDTNRRGYRVGSGPDGNVGRDTITYIVLRKDAWSGINVKPRNPLPARGGTAPEPVAMVKLLAPSAFRTRRERAITAEDYAELAQRDGDIQRAAADLRWTGSWYEARVSVDPLHTTEFDARLSRRIAASLEPFRRVGHDLAVGAARYVPIELAIDCCALPHYAAGQIKAELAKVFSNRRLADGRLGFFHPDRLTFGSDIYLSQIVAAAQAVEGVASVKIRTLRRQQHEPAGDALDSGVLRLGALEIAQLANDPNYPENGKLTLTVGGGR